MPRNPFIGRTQSWLETKLNALQDMKANLTLQSSWSGGDVSSTKTQIAEIETTIDQLLYALYLLDSDTYPLASIQRQTRTVGRIRNQ